jgi:hypothetical protein
MRKMINKKQLHRVLTGTKDPIFGTQKGTRKWYKGQKKKGTFFF